MVIKDKELGCSQCAEASRLGLGPKLGSGLKPIKEWIEGKVCYFGKTKEMQQNSLRKKIHTHKTFVNHKRGEQAKASAKSKPSETGKDKMCLIHCETTNRLFMTAYKVAKLGHPFTDFPVDVQVQQLNGLDMVEFYTLKLVALISLIIFVQK